MHHHMRAFSWPAPHGLARIRADRVRAARAREAAELAARRPTGYLSAWRALHTLGRATQINRSGAVATVTLATKVADHIGGWARVYQELR